MVRSILVGLASLVAPGFAHGLMGQYRAMAIAIAAFWLAVFGNVLTVWALALAFAVLVGIAIHAGWTHRRLQGRIRWQGLPAALTFVGFLVVATVNRRFVAEAFKIPASSMYPTLQLDDHIFVEKVWRSYERGEVVVFKMPCQPEVDYVKRIVGVANDTVEVRCGVLYVNGRAVRRELIDATCTYDDRDDTTDRMVARECSRYRETLDGHTFDIFHERDEPEREARREPDSKDFPNDALVRSCGGNPDQAAGKIAGTRSDPENACAPRLHFVVPADSLFVLGDNRDNSNDSRYWGVVPVSYVRGHATGVWLPLSRFGTIR